MKRYDSDEELERALFALDLEEPPADLRASILSGTIYRPPLPVKPWEIWLLGACCAILAWVSVFLVHGNAEPAISTINSYLSGALAAFAKPETLFWTAAGAGMALWVSQLNLTLVPGALRATRR